MRPLTKREKMNELAVLITLVIIGIDFVILIFGKQFFTFIKSIM